MLKFEEVEKQVVRIKVVGIGGGGSNAIDHLIEAGIGSVDFAVINTDVQALARSVAPEKIQIGKKITRGMGTGGNPDLGKQAALDDKELIIEMLEGVDILFITAGFGGGTGTGASGIVAQVAKDAGVLTVGVVTKPFSYEGKKRTKIAEDGIVEFKELVDTIICVPNDKIFEMADKNTPLCEAYRLTDSVLMQAVLSISRVITKTGLINLDFSDIRTILANSGNAVIAFGEGFGTGKAENAVKEALKCPLLELKDLNGAKRILISILSGSDLTLFEVHNALGSIHNEVDEDADKIIGHIFDDDLKDKTMITIIATGLNSDLKQETSTPDYIPIKNENSEIEEEPEEIAEKFSEIEPEPILDDEYKEEKTDEQYYENESEEEEEPEQEEENIYEEEPVEVAAASSRKNEYDTYHRGIFDKSESTIYKGVNLDIPAYMRDKKIFREND